ncbi:tyrosine protein phosphatase [Legionella geestiana]|uniref:phosphatase domain-containing protein n=1 Tax=Legionella geestiana TaxID=45065 RepID=UPI001092A1ED|nr:tyrosine protein phosphatase [Legionella geestiana]QDQ39100.1 tyrosine protein phosphatase [Legionella geestiana]
MKYFFLAVFGFQSAVFAAAEVCEATLEKPCIVQDSSQASQPITALRDLQMISDWYPGNTRGIEVLHASASAQPSASGWMDIAHYLATLADAADKQVLVLDLRQEIHGYLNGSAITLSDRFNWINLGKTATEGALAEVQWLEGLASSEVVENVLSVRQFRRHEFDAGVSVSVERVQQEPELFLPLNWRALRLPVTDHRAPLDETVDRFVSLVDSLPENTWMHLHCRGGKGRTTTFLALLDMLKNADKASFEDIIERQASIPPFYDLSQIVRENPELTPWYYERLRFLQRFYAFAHERFEGYEGSWTAWKRSHPEVNAEKLT